MNDTTFNEITKTLAGTTRLSVLNKNTKLFCHKCQAVKTVTDVFPNATVALECGHRRDIFNWTPAEKAEYFAEVKARGSKKKAKGSNNPNKSFEIVYELSEGEHERQYTTVPGEPDDVVVEELRIGPAPRVAGEDSDDPYEPETTEDAA